MVEAARRRAAELGVGNAEFRVVDATAIPLPDGSLDGVLCRFGLMLVVDVDAAFAELARVLRSGGRAAIAVWAEPALNDWITAGGRAALELGLIDRPDEDAPGPFRLADASRLRSLVERAGLVVETVEDVPVTWRAASLGEWWDASLDMSRMLALLRDRIDAAQLEALRAGATARLGVHVRPDGSLVVPGLARAALVVRP
jgi:SAM-dependent methyltransferase